VTSDRTSRRSPAVDGIRRGLLIVLVGAFVASVGGSVLGVLPRFDVIGSRVSTVGLVLSGALATVALVARGWREPALRRSWLLLAVAPMAETVWLAGALAPVFGHRPLLSEPAGDIGHLLAVPFVIAALLGLPVPEHDRRTRLRTGLDVVAAAFAFGALTYNFGIPAGTNLLGALQPLFGMALGTAVVAVLARARHDRSLSLATMLTIVAGIFVVGVSETLAAFHLNHTGWSAQDPYLAIGAVGHLLLAYGSMRPVGTRDSVASLRRREQIAVMAPILPILPAGIVVIISIFTGVRLALMTLILLGLLVASVLVAAVFARLDQLVLSRTLEHRVVERTLALRTHAKWFRALVQNSSDVITIVDASGTIRYQTPSAARVLGYDPNAMVGRRFGALLSKPDSERLEAILVDAALRPRSSQNVEFAMMHSDGHWCETETVVTSLVDDHDIRGLVLNTRDVSERKELERQLTRQAFSDSLTGLANRALFRNRVEHAIEERAGSTGQVAVLFLDLDGFKGVNDAQGHLVGDNLLSLVADRLRHCVGPGDTVARLGGDEFAILIVGPSAERVAIQVADRIRQVLSQPFVLDGREVALAASTGIAVTDLGDETADQLLRNADLAMYRAKVSRDGSFVRFQSEMHDALLLRVQAESDLRQALGRGQLALHYQPTVNLHTGQVVGVEALIRWYHPTRGLVQPMDFIGLAEETGLVESIGEWAIRECCRQGARWQAYAPAGGIFHVAVNVSSRQLTPRLPEIVREALSETGMFAGALVIEMTESVLIERTEEAIAVLRQLKSLGTRIAIDDFGTGYSSLSYLTRFPVDILKIDKSFVEQLSIKPDGLDGPPGSLGADGGRGGSSDSAELARTIVHLGHSLRLGTVAEGIETREQYTALVNMACDYGQGFLFSRPLPAEGIDTLFAHLLVSTLPTPQVVYNATGLTA
jgi:diguanylate cyclase (GGDEF)-like protein/PAS domain S-box-containing protein